MSNLLLQICDNSLSVICITNTIFHSLASIFIFLVVSLIDRSPNFSLVTFINQETLPSFAEMMLSLSVTLKIKENMPER